MKKISFPAVEILIELYRKGEITNSKSGIYALSFYPIIRQLRALKLIHSDCTNERNEKIWKLTEKGKSVAHHYNCLNDIWKVKE
jgi:hypothetical protein